MTRPALALAAVLALLAPAAAGAKDPEDPVRVSWNGAPPGETPAGGTWDVALTLVQGPGGFYPETPVHPVLVVTNRDTGARQRLVAAADGAENAFRARVRFARAGRYFVSLTRFDPRSPTRTADMNVRIAVPAGASSGSDGSAAPWGWIAGASLALAALGGAALARR